ncbi:MAG: restriction endonuclease subunit S, partial [Pseudanabaena sp.]
MSKDLAGLPKGWKVVRLGEISKDIQSGGTPLRNQKSFYEGSIPWVKTLDLNEGVVNCTEEK